MNRLIDHQIWKNRSIACAVGILLVLLCLVSFPLIAQSTLDTIQPIPALDTSRARLVEGETYCYVGYGSHQHGINVNGQATRIQSLESVASLISLLDTPYVKVGCAARRFFVEYGQITERKRISPSLAIESVTYDAIQFVYVTLTTGYTFTILPNRLYIDFGLGYNQSQYTLDIVGTTTTYKSHSGGFHLDLGIELFLSHFISFEWRHSTAISNTSLLSDGDQIGVNLIVGF